MCRNDPRLCGGAAALVLFGIQILAMGFFPGDERGFNLAVGAVSFPHYAYTGLVKNEAESHDYWECPFSETLYQGLAPGVSLCMHASCFLLGSLPEAAVPLTKARQKSIQAV